VTSTQYTGNLGGLAGADAKCQARAVAGGWTGTYKAWLSDATASPSTRFTRGGPYQLTDAGGSVLANNWTGLTTKNLLHLFNVTEYGGVPAGSGAPCVSATNPTGVWSATDETGLPGSVATLSCSNWTSTTSVGSAWGTTNNLGFWSSWCSGGNMANITCGTSNPLYCFQQ
jgi:hypothetical protein